MKHSQFRVGAFLLMLVMLCALMPLALAQNNNIEAYLEVPALDSHKGLSIPKIDIVSDYPSGVSFKYRMNIHLTNEQFNQYIAPLAENGKWKRDQAKNFTITFPADLFDQELLTIDWGNAGTSDRFFMQVRSSDETNGIVLEGQQSSSYVNPGYADFCLYVTMPVTFSPDKYQAAVEKGGLALKGDVIINGGAPGTPPLIYTVDHTIPVIDSDHLKPSLIIKDSDGNVPQFVKNEWILTPGEYTITGTAHDYEGVSVLGDATLNLTDVTIERTSTDGRMHGPAIRIEGGNVKLNLSGDNVVQGSPGNAGIYVGVPSTLTIYGPGSLTATGGDAYRDVLPDSSVNLRAGGAGIGGNGLCQQANGGKFYELPSFGQININSGTVTATGGSIRIDNYGGGAGIGSGGNSSKLGRMFTPEGTVHISGGTVTAIGGDNKRYAEYSGGGAGIGTGGIIGDAFRPLKDETKIIIEGGTVDARGGTDAAGIGSGANTDCRSISITGGVIDAIGGDQKNGECYGGAGIGSGDNGGAFSIVISGTADVTAKGAGAAAGIGSGNNANADPELGKCGLVEISGSARVTATGGSETSEDKYGGAGIGSGYTGNVGKISILGDAEVTATGGNGAAGISTGHSGDECALVEISGNARVTATGGSEKASYKYGAAGIGGGRYGNVNQINILENAHVTAIGGNGGAGIGGGFNGAVVNGITIEGATVEAHGSSGYEYHTASYNGYGGAGIGSGVRWNTSLGCGAISITKGATVRAYTDGRATNAIGAGGRYNKGDNSLHLDDSISLWAQTPDNTRSALLDAACGPTTYASSGVYLTTNNLTTGKADGYLNQPGAQADEAWAFQLGTDLTIDGNPVAMAAPKAPVGNWATLYQLPTVKVTYQYVGELPDGAAPLTPDSVAPGAPLAPKQPANVIGWVFDGWYTDEDCTAKFAGDAGITGDAVLYGRWNPLSTPIDPKAAVYKVEHVQKQPDGTYKLVDAEFPLYGELGQTVTAVPKSYEGYVVNRAASTLSGVVIPPAGDVYLVLTVRYDPAPQVTATPQPGAVPQSASVPPRTGDSSSPLLWLSLLIASALGMGGVVASKSKMW